MSGQVIQEKDLVAIAVEYGLPWPPKDRASVKQAYRAAMLKHHPDRGGTAAAASKINHWQDCALALLDGRLVKAQPHPQPRVQQIVIFGGSPWDVITTGSIAGGDYGFGFSGGWVTIRFG